ncbi:MAG: chorismate--pyruvate lyase family protein [Candidatus Methylopumilus sp.]
MIWLKSPTIKGHEFSWLTEEGSLTERLKNEFDDVKVDVIYEGLALEEETDYIREVMIKSHDKPMIFAHTRLKMNELEDAWTCLKTLGEQSLANILFKDPHISRRSLLYRVCESEDVLYKRLKSLDYMQEEILWMRQSEWERYGKILLLTEVFLPNLFNQR